MSSSLPISQHKKSLLYAIDNNDVTLISAETGSGKTTQIPQMLIQGGYTIGNKIIGVVVGRRIAAIGLAQRVAEELGCHNGQIAHKVRFNSNETEHTRLLFLTPGILLHQISSDPLLPRYSVLILDDFHQRSLEYELLFGLLRKILQKRKGKQGGLRLVVMSADDGVGRIKEWILKDKNIKGDGFKLSVDWINVTGRMFKVGIHYLTRPTKNYFLKTYQTLLYLITKASEGTILTFLPSLQEINSMASLLQTLPHCPPVLLLHSKIPLQEQQKIYEPGVKLILSTNIAESAITVEGVKYVVDCGYVRCKIQEGPVQRMIVVPCGKSSADQRAGRAGRTEDGQCYRIYTREAYQSMNPSLPSELNRISLAPFLLTILSLGLSPITFDLLDPPSPTALASAYDLLYAYDLVDENGTLTEKGRIVGQLGLELKHGVLLVNSFQHRFGCSKQILMLVAMLQASPSNIFSTNGVTLLKAKKKIGSKEGDFLTLINIFIRYHHAKPNDKKRICGQYKLRYESMEQAVKIHSELQKMVNRLRKVSEAEMMRRKYGDQENIEQGSKKLSFQIKSSSDEYEAILRCILSAYFPNLAQMQPDNSYLAFGCSSRLTLHPTSILSVVYPEWIIFQSISKSPSSPLFYVHNASMIQPEWIFEIAGHYYKDRRKQIIEEDYGKELKKQVPQQEMRPQNAEDQEKLVQVGGFKKKKQTFNTNVLGLKKMSKNTLSFQDDI